MIEVESVNIISSVALVPPLANLLSQRYHITPYLSPWCHMIFTNIVPHRSILSPLLLDLESLGISINHLDRLNNDRELYCLAENLKQEFINKIKETEEQGLFVNPGGG